MRTSRSFSMFGMIVLATFGLVFGDRAQAQAVKLNIPLTFGEAAGFYRVSADSSRVVYHVLRVFTPSGRIYSVSIAGGPSIHLNASPGSAMEVPHDGFALTADSEQVVFLDRDILSSMELHIVPIMGGTVVKLNAPLVSGGEVVRFLIAPGDDRVVYLADQDVDDVNEIYSVPIGGGTVTKLNGPLVGGGNVKEFQISRDGSRVVYLADQDTEEVDEIYSVPIAGGPVTRLNGALVAGGSVDIESTRISRDSSRVVYRAIQDTAGVRELFSVPIAGGPVVKLNGALVTDGRVRSFRVSADSNWVAYTAVQDTAEFTELYSVAIAGGPVTKLSPPMSGRRAEADDIVISRDSGWVVFSVDQGRREICSVPIAGGTVNKLNRPYEDDGVELSHKGFAISAGSDRVVYMANPIPGANEEIYSVPITGGLVIKLNPPLVIGGTVKDFYFLEDHSLVGNRVIYRAKEGSFAVDEIFSVPITVGIATKLSGPSVDVGGGIGAYRVSPDASRVLYTAEQDVAPIIDLYSVDLAEAVSDVPAMSVWTLVVTVLGLALGGVVAMRRTRRA